MSLLPAEVIRKKRDGVVLDSGEIGAFIQGLVSGSIADSQAAAFAMATYFRGMTIDETVALTLAMRDSGETLSWLGLDGPVLDKHSTGGIGDKVSLILAPLMAAIGAYVPMISGRGLGHTGGTLDKLDSIPGYDTRADLARFRKTVREAGCAIVGQTAELAPADGKLYAIRDVTATVDISPMIVASILSKKLASGLDGLVMDVKVGSGAFMPSIDAARSLAGDLVAVSEGAGLPCHAVLTDMNQCLGRTAGNALEVREAIEVLTGRPTDSRLRSVTLALAARLAERGGLAEGADEAMRQLERALDEGKAAERFQRMIAALGGPSDLIDHPDRHLASAPIKRPVVLEDEGHVRSIDVRSIGLAIIELGGGRTNPTDKIDTRVGLSRISGVGEWTDKSHPFAVIHAASEAEADRAQDRIRNAVSTGPDPLVCDASPILGEIAP